MPSVTKDDGFSVYRVRGGRGDYEWATIAVREWCTQPDPMCGNERRQCGEILIYSSFGSWAYQWGHLGRPFRSWLLGCEFGYVFGKFMGDKLMVFDGEASVQYMRQRLIEKRWHRDMDKKIARVVWDELNAHESQAEASDRDFVEAMGDIADRIREGWSIDTEIPDLFDSEKQQAYEFLQEPWERIMHKNAPQAVGFWRDLWPVFINHLRAELQPAAAAA
jgi:hypothetical protein